ncbi:MAG: DUF4124 domain-containing protein [Burkholderiaceae bacterium]|nr:DUF4124 domain-containing protein [Burkholderiaceae bacterium]
MKNQTSIKQQRRQARPALTAMAALVAALWCAQPAQAQQVWRCTDGNKVIYSQTECPGGAADAITVQPNTIDRSAERAHVTSILLQKQIQQEQAIARMKAQQSQQQAAAQENKNKPQQVAQEEPENLEDLPAWERRARMRRAMTMAMGGGWPDGRPRYLAPEKPAAAVSVETTETSPTVRTGEYGMGWIPSEESDWAGVPEFK